MARTHRRTIHLCQRGVTPVICLACGQPVTFATAAICWLRSDWDTIYQDNPSFRRCTDDLTPIERRPHRRYPTPTTPGYYWAEWRIVEDGTFHGYDPAPVIGVPEVVEVYDRGAPDQSDLQVAIPGIEKPQPLENFLWRSARLTPPTS